MWKKRFLPYSFDHKTAAPQPTTSSKLNDSEVQDAQLQQHHGRQLPPDARHNIRVPSNETPAQFSGNQWTQVPVVQQVIPISMQSNPINHINQQQVVYDMEMHRARQDYEMQHYTPVSGTFNNYSSVPVISTITPTFTHMQQDMMDEWKQHERYLQQARDMQVPGTEQWGSKLLPVEEMTGVRPFYEDIYKISNTEHVNKMMSRRNSYKAVMKNGELVESKNGHLIVTHNLPLNNNQESLYSDIPLDLSMKSGSSQMEVKQLDTDSVFINSPPNNDDARGINLAKNVPNQSLVKSEKINNKDISLKVANMTKLLPRIAPKPSPVNVLATKPPLVKAIQPKDEVLGEETKDQTIAGTDPATLEREDIHRMFPLLKTTNTGSLVLWNFLWALLQDENYNTILSWVSFNNLKFRIVNPSMLATFWGKVKQNPAMDWGKIKKILDLYQRKNLIISCQTELEFIFKIIPKTVKDNLESANK